MFLLDTSAISALTNRSHARHTNAVVFKDQHVGQEQRLFVCVISLAEMQFGLNMYEMRAPRPSEADLDALRKHIQAAGNLSEPLEVTHHVAMEQGRRPRRLPAAPDHGVHEVRAHVLHRGRERSMTTMSHRHCQLVT